MHFVVKHLHYKSSFVCLVPLAWCPALAQTVVHIQNKAELDDKAHCGHTSLQARI